MSGDVVAFNELARLAEKQGLVVQMDRDENYYLFLANPPDDGTANPWAVKYREPREEVLHYLRTHRGEHRVLRPDEVLYKVINNPVSSKFAFLDDDDEPTS